mmetsp:Transcript_76499/g.211755  ORF Transcript_76499/g.211755 Transcript_76499/m.211755 type:complete len:240 (+) Transcript_76499:415-1134(+)
MRPSKRSPTPRPPRLHDRQGLRQMRERASAPRLGPPGAVLGEHPCGVAHATRVHRSLGVAAELLVDEGRRASQRPEGQRASRGPNARPRRRNVFGLAEDAEAVGGPGRAVEATEALGRATMGPLLRRPHGIAPAVAAIEVWTGGHRREIGRCLPRGRGPRLHRALHLGNSATHGPLRVPEVRLLKRVDAMRTAPRLLEAAPRALDARPRCGRGGATNAPRLAALSALIRRPLRSVAGAT